MPRKQPANTDNKPISARVMLTESEWKKILHLIDNKTVEVVDAATFNEYQVLQEKVLMILNGPGLFDTEKDEGDE